jgi:hypothetical protein
MAMYFIGLCLLLAMIGGVIFALIRQSGTNIYGSVKVITWCTLAYLIVGNMFASLHASFASITNPGMRPDTFQYIRYSASISPFDSPALMAMLIFSIITCGFLGSSGLFLMRSFRKEHHLTTPPLPPAFPPQPVDRDTQLQSEETRTDG